MPIELMLPAATSEMESALLGVLLSAGSAREGAAALLHVISPLADDGTLAIAARDRDGLTLHVLADSGAPGHWPRTLEPQFALGGSPGVDSRTSVMVIPLRANGRVVGALLFGDFAVGSELLHAGPLAAVVQTIADVLHELLARTEEESRRRADALHSPEAILEGMAHQMANPLMGASAIAQMLVEDLQDEDTRSTVRQIQHELSRVFTVIHDLLEFQRDARAQDGVLDLNAVAERIVRFRAYAIREQGITVQFEMVPGFMGVRADARGLEHAMLIALRFAELHSHGTVNRSIGVRVVDRGPKEVAVEIVDSGLGKIPELTTSYFDMPLHSERSARHMVDDNPDLGLVDSILRSCGGSLQVKGTKTDGTTLVLVLPRANTAAPNSIRNQA
jgi:signal transduction histidine kinase